MVRKNLEGLIILAGIFVMACSGGGSGNGGGSGSGLGNNSTSETHSKKSEVHYSDITDKEPDDSGHAGRMKLRRVISMTMDFANNDGLAELNGDLSLKFGTGIPIEFKSSVTQECASGGTVLIDSKLFKITNYQQANEKTEEVQTITDGDSIVLNSGVYYFIRAHVKISGLCTGFKSLTTAEMHF